MREGRLRGRTALVTGAAKRLGRAIALALAEEGADVAVHYRRSEREAEGLKDELEALGVRSWVVGADLGKAEECEGLVERAAGAAGSLDILVNSASVFAPSTLGDVTLEALMENMRVNAWAPLVLSRELAARADRGAIVNLLDTRVAGGDRAHVAYIVSKQALAMLTEMMAVEFAPGITVNGVAPGLILPPPGEDESYLEGLAGTVPLRRHGDASDVAEAVVYLATSDFVTGQVINVDGGRHVMEYGRGPNPD